MLSVGLRSRPGCGVYTLEEPEGIRSGPQDANGAFRHTPFSKTASGTRPSASDSDSTGCFLCRVNHRKQVSSPKRKLADAGL